MSKKTLVECDGCGQEQLEEATRDWITATFKVGNAGQEEAHLCSFACVGRYGNRRQRDFTQQS